MKKNLPFTINTRMSDLILKDYRLIPVVGRFGINFGFGNSTVAEVCTQYAVNEWFFLEIVNSFHNLDYFPKKQLQNFKAELIIQYLVNTHEYYLNNKVPEVDSIIEKMKETTPEDSLSNVNLLNTFFKEYKEELTHHLKVEEQEVFPYILELERALKKGEYPQALKDRVKLKPIETYESTHDDVDVKLSDLKNLLIRHLPPLFCKELCQKLLTELFRLENDLIIHSRIEDKVLIPKVKQLEIIFLQDSEI